MEKNTLLAVVLSVIVITVGFMVQNFLYPPVVEPPQAVESTAITPSTPSTERGAESGSGTVAAAPAVFASAVVPVGEVTGRTQPVVYQNEVLRVTMDPRGARVTSIQLLEHFDAGQPVEMIMRGESNRAAFELQFGGHDAPPVDALFNYVETVDAHTFRFTRDFAPAGNEAERFTVTRTYRFYPGEYMFEVSVALRNARNAELPLNFNGAAYSLSVGPQIGPSYAELDGRNEFRRFFYYQNDRRREVRIRNTAGEPLNERVQWVSTAGKYFAVIALPGSADFRYVFSTTPAPGLRDGATMSLVRPVVRSAAVEDTYRFFVGPKVGRVLNRYNSAQDNALGVRDLNIDAVEDARPLLGWLENILKFVMQLIYHVVPNYGVAIIILTILVKLALFPLTHRSSESTSKMQAFNPQLQQLRVKYKDNPQKLNQAMAELYKKEGVNPLGGCLPLLLQFPFFIAMFGLFNNHFDLRGATFIQGWITDLSAPESIWNFGTTLPLLGWTDLRLLPILFVGSQLLSSKLMQPATAGGDQTQMKIMQYGMPIMFFFILYNMPSGLLVYWIFSNILAVAQQYYINTRMKRQRTE